MLKFFLPMAFSISTAGVAMGAVKRTCANADATLALEVTANEVHIQETYKDPILKYLAANIYTVRVAFKDKTKCGSLDADLTNVTCDATQMGQHPDFDLKFLDQNGNEVAPDHAVYPQFELSPEPNIGLKVSTGFADWDHAEGETHTYNLSECQVD